MRRFTPFLITALILLIGIFLATGILALFFIMMCKIITIWTNFTLFEATILCVAVTFVDAFMIFIYVYLNHKYATLSDSCVDDNDHGECDCPPCVAKRKNVEDTQPLVSLNKKRRQKS